MSEDAETPPDPLDQAIARALAAAEAATDAAHEAEAALADRAALAATLRSTARRAGWMAAASLAAALVCTLAGGLVWLRSAADLHDAASLQAEATAGFVEQVLALDRIVQGLDAAMAGNTALTETLSARLADLDGRISGDVGTLLQALREMDQTLPSRLAEGQDAALQTLRGDLINAIAEMQLPIPAGTGGSDTGDEATLTRLAEITGRLEALIPRAAAPATGGGGGSGAKAKPRPAASAEPNAFHFP